LLVFGQALQVPLISVCKTPTLLLLLISEPKKNVKLLLSYNALYFVIANFDCIVGPMSTLIYILHLDLSPHALIGNNLFIALLTSASKYNFIIFSGQKGHHFFSRVNFYSIASANRTGYVCVVIMPSASEIYV
jgi:hypothetical protein